MSANSMAVRVGSPMAAATPDILGLGALMAPGVAELSVSGCALTFIL
ncbi:MAG: hypothetical protein M0Z54_16350 [Thermaerobacter sp.]|nr:hypothetical protein [Thermaerobacter sp.]